VLVYAYLKVLREKLLSNQPVRIFVLSSFPRSIGMCEIDFGSGFDCYFSQFFSSNPLTKYVIKTGLLDNTIAAGHFKQKADAYLEKHGLKNDYMGEQYGNNYDLLVLCSDIVVPSTFKHVKKVWVQEGMIDPLNTWSKIVKTLRLPRYLAISTALNGASNLCDISCVASEGYKDFFEKRGTDRDKIIVTGMPNYDNVKEFLKNDFPHRNYVFVATSDVRETFRKDDRPAFIRNCVEIAAGRPLIFKLHPNEIAERAVQEIKENTPEGTLIFTEGNTNHMIANCDELITQYSTVVYVGIALNKKIHSYFDKEELYRLAPIQNDGASAKNIADLCRDFIYFKGSSSKAFLSKYTVTEHRDLVAQ
jgi:hypothetical protein